jgi:hypothetical protein
MATTTNYGWTTPDDTALVKDGAAAIRTLGSSVDTTTKNLNPETTLGDLAYRSSTANVKTRLGIGSTGQVLTVAAGVPSWATPAAGGDNFALLNSGGTALSGAQTVTVSGISANELFIKVEGFNAGAYDTFAINFNSDTGNNYSQIGTRNESTNTFTRYKGVGIGYVNIGRDNDAGNSDAHFYLRIFGASGTGNKPFIMNSYGTGTDNFSYTNQGVYFGTSAITSVTFATLSAQTFSTGTLFVYGA